MAPQLMEIKGRDFRSPNSCSSLRWVLFPVPVSPNTNMLRSVGASLLIRWKTFFMGAQDPDDLETFEAARRFYCLPTRSAEEQYARWGGLWCPQWGVWAVLQKAGDGIIPQINHTDEITSIQKRYTWHWRFSGRLRLGLSNAIREGIGDDEWLFGLITFSRMVSEWLWLFPMLCCGSVFFSLRTTMSLSQHASVAQSFEAGVQRVAWIAFFHELGGEFDQFSRLSSSFLFFFFWRIASCSVSWNVAISRNLRCWSRRLMGVLLR